MLNNTNNANIVEFSVETGVLLFDTKRNTIIGFERRYDYLDSDLDCDLDYDLDSASEDVRSYKIVIPKTINGFEVKKIGNKSLCELWQVEEIILPDTIEEIEERAFCYSSIKKITIPKNVNKIGAQVFGGCRYLENIYVDEENKYFSSYDGILYNKDMTELIYCAQHNKCGETVIIPDGVKKICQDAFMFTSIDELILPNSVEVLEKWAFYKNYLFKIKLSSNITKIEEACFLESQWLYSIEIPEGVVSIEDRAFGDCFKLKHILIPKSVTKISEDAFEISPYWTIFIDNEDGGGDYWGKMRCITPEEAEEEKEEFCVYTEKDSYAYKFAQNKKCYSSDNYWNIKDISSFPYKF